MDVKLIQRQRQPADETEIRELMTVPGVPALMAELLAGRGIRTAKEVEAFLNPAEGCFHDPFGLPDMELARDRIICAVLTGQKLCVYGDYDADGVCATAILLRALKRLGADAEAYIPSRLTEGYGMNRCAVEMLKERGVSLIITVDNGIAALEEAKLCRELGISLIVTDHHRPGPVLPEAEAVVAASREDSTYPCSFLSGAGIAMKLACALEGGAPDAFSLALAGVAAVADVVPLLDENRTLTARGLQAIRTVPGFRALLEASGTKEDAPVTSDMISFTIAPRLNAAGRMGHAERALLLLMSESMEEARRTAAELEQDNRDRRQLEAVIAEEITDRAAAEIAEGKRALIFSGAAWHPGVIGIAAARLTETFHVPTILFSERDGEFTGSCRCVDGIDLYEELSRFQHLFLRFGGHASAAGITLSRENYPVFREDFERRIREAYPEEVFTPRCEYDAEVSPEALTVDLEEALSRMEPFGTGNLRPCFCLRGMEPGAVKTMGALGNHLSVTLQGTGLRAVGFGMGTERERLSSCARCDVAGTLMRNEFRGNVAAELRLTGIAVLPPGPEDLFLRALQGKRTDAGSLPLTPVSTERLRELYADLRKRLIPAGIPVRQATGTWSPEELLAAAVFAEAGYFCEEGGTVKEITPSRRTGSGLDRSGLYRTWMNARR